MISSNLEASSSPYAAFVGPVRLATGELGDMAVTLQRAEMADPVANLLLFDRRTGKVVDLDLRGSEAEVRARYALPTVEPVRRGRPRLGVVPREVTLLPRHWDWLASQSGGASVAIRRLVEAARKAEAAGGDARRRSEAAYRFMSATAGDRPGFEAAARALFADNLSTLKSLIAIWPPDIADEILKIRQGAVEDPAI